MRATDRCRLLPAVACGLSMLLPAVGADAQGTADLAARAAEARARLQAIETRAERLADLNEIENLQRAFGYYFDKMLWEHVADLFTGDATLEIGSSGVYAGKDSIRRYLYALGGGREGPIEGVLFDHFQLQPIVTIAPDGNSAQGRWRALIMTGVHGAGSGGNWGEGPYENEYVKDGGIWKISKLRWYPTFIAPYEGGWLSTGPAAVDEYSRPEGAEPDRPPSRDCAPFPSVCVPPFHYANPASGK